MIKINGQMINLKKIFQDDSNQEQNAILNQLEKKGIVYDYPSIQELNFEIQFRVQTIQAAKDLNNSGAKFTTFTYSFCNKKYWNRLNNGGFLLKQTATPSEALLDILRNGSLYAFECSTAIAIVLYIAALRSIGLRAFNEYFAELYLMDWQFDEDLPIYQKDSGDYLIGDVLHFKNPDFDPQQPHWRAENVIYFGNDLFYGHGIGIQDSSTILEFLNKKRKNNPSQSAFLMKLITRPYYPTLYLLKING